MNEKERNYRFIKNFNKITLSDVCDTVAVCRQNVTTNKTSAENMKKVRCELESRLNNLFEEDSIWE